MNLEQVALDEKEGGLPVAKRSFQLADEQACDNDQLHQLTLPTTSSLNQLDGLTLSNIILMLYTASISLLMQTGDQALRLKIASNVRRLYYLGADLPKFESITEGHRVWLLPELLTLSTPRLTTLIINRTRSASLCCDLTHLPSTLTRFSLFDVRIIISNVEDMMFNLPALLDLRISSVEVRISKAMANETLYPLGDVPDQCWVVNALKSSPLLRRVSYRLMPSESFISSAAVASLFLLEELEVKRFTISKECWPRHLHTLTLTSSRVEDVCSIPDTVTHLDISCSTISNETLATWLSMVPSTLLHLRINGRHVTFGDDIWLLITRFTQLQTLLIPRFWNYNGGLPSSLGDLTLLPNTIKVMSISFAVLPSQWSQLPIGVAFVDERSNAIVRRSKLPCYCRRTHLTHVAHFPKRLHRLCLRDSFLPLGLDALCQLHIDLSLVAYHLVESSQFLQHVPPTLVVLSIDVEQATSFFSFAGVDMAERFPVLSSLCLRLQTACLKDDNNTIIIEWINNVPKSIRCLQLDVFQVHHQVIRPVIYLDQVVFSPGLSRLCINAPTHIVQLPANLPRLLHSIEIRCHDISTLESCDHIAQWPLSLANFTIALEASSTSLTYARCKLAKTQLERRISTSKGHKFTLRAATPPFL